MALVWHRLGGCAAFKRGALSTYQISPYTSLSYTKCTCLLTRACSHKWRARPLPPRPAPVSRMRPRVSGVSLAHPPEASLPAPRQDETPHSPLPHSLPLSHHSSPTPLPTVPAAAAQLRFHPVLCGAAVPEAAPAARTRAAVVRRARGGDDEPPLECRRARP